MYENYFENANIYQKNFKLQNFYNLLLIFQENVMLLAGIL